MIAQEAKVVSGGQTVTLSGGTYGVEITGTVSAGGSVVLQRLGPDGTSYANVGTSIGSGGTPNYQTVTVPFGGYKLTVVSGSSIQAELNRVPPP